MGVNHLLERSWEIILNVILKTFPNVDEIDPLLPQDLQIIEYQERQRSQAEAEESKRKFREATFENIRKSAAANRKLREEKLKELRFDYTKARRYSLEHKP
jgi:hypothetical protein